MKYLVMECKDSYCILLDESGRFVYAANLGYTLGEVIGNPFLMEEMDVQKTSHPQRWIRWTIAAMTVCSLFLWLSMLGRSYLSATTTLLLTINPAVQLELNRYQQVVRLNGVNEDGKRLIEGYSAKGKDHLTVTDELIDRAIHLGYLYEGGKITIEIDARDDAELEDVGIGLRENLNAYLENRLTVTVEIRSKQAEPDPKVSEDQSIPGSLDEQAESIEEPSSPPPAVLEDQHEDDDLDDDDDQADNDDDDEDDDDQDGGDFDRDEEDDDNFDGETDEDDED